MKIEDMWGVQGLCLEKERSSITNIDMTLLNEL